MKLIIAGLILISMLFALPFQALAQSRQNNQNDVVLLRDKIVNEDYFAAGDSVLIEGTVNGDAYVAGGNVVVDGTINGDLLTAGGNLDIRGTVTGNIRAAGGNINVSSNVGRNATLVGGNLNISSDANIAENLVSVGGQLTINSDVGSNVNAAVGQLNLASNASINGKLNYISNNRANISQEATVSGQITRNFPEDRQIAERGRDDFGNVLNFFRFANFILAAIIGLLLLAFLPVYFDNTANLILRRPWINLGIGLLTVVISPIIFILLLITVIGIPVAFVLAFILMTLLCLAKIFVAFAIGQILLKLILNSTNKIWAFVLGLIIYFLLTAVPIFGWIISILAALIGLGAILTEKRNIYRLLREKQII